MHRILKSIPLFLACGVILFPLLLWLLSTSLGHIHPFFPYVSDLGIVPPEASLFSLCMCGGAALIALFVLLRYDLNQSFAEKSTFLTADKSTAAEAADLKDPTRQSEILRNAKLSLCSGLLMSVGFLLIGCFRNNEIPLIQMLHNIFAAVGFSGAIVDIYLESRLASLLGNDQLARFRRIILLLCILSLVIYSTNGVGSFLANPVALEDKHTRLMWSLGENGYLLHVISTVVEWILIYLLSPYFYTFHAMFMRAQYLTATVSNAV